MPNSAAGQSESLKALLILAALTLATRAWIFGNPVIGIDEQFYLLAGDRLLDGVLPYVDIWDRKPIGLFLIYALASRLFPDPVVGYQLLSAVSVVLTSWLLFTIARRLASFPASLAAAAAYPAWLLVFAGVGGQSPTYYNLPMLAGAALLLTIIAQTDDRHLSRRGCAIMLLAGIALQIKYAAVFDGIFFGLTLLWAGWQRSWSLARLAANALIWIGCALLATLAAWAVYAALGHGEAFVQANFLSIFGDINSLSLSLARLAGLSFGLSPFWIGLWIAWKHRQSAPVEARWTMAWAGASFAGFLLFGVYYDHYVLPLLLPLCLAAALAFDRIARKRLAMALVIGLGLAGGFGRAIVDVRHYGNGAEASRLAAMIKPHLGKGCLYVNEEVPILYWLTNSCLPTRYAFPEHLVLYRYEHALGTDQLGELRRIFAQRPAVVVKSLAPDDDTRAESRAVLEAGLARDYRLVGKSGIGQTTFEVYALVRP
jgi:4-amino-4-deoxy-L-arabinose transferase-like glycosyltransferase